MWLNKNGRLTRRLFAVLAVVLTIALVSGCGNNEASENVVATYKDGSVSEAQLASFMSVRKFFSNDQYYELYEQMFPGFKETMLRQLIATRLLGDELDKKLRDESTKQAKSDIDDLVKSLEGDAATKAQFEQSMEQFGITTDDMVEYFAMQYNMQKYFVDKFKEEEIRQQYDKLIAENEHKFTIASVRHVLVAFEDLNGTTRTNEEALKRAQEAYTKLKNGGDWVAVVKEYSDDGTRDSGGLYANADVNGWVENFRMHAIEQPTGEVGEPFETEYGYHVMLVEDRTEQPYDTVKETVKLELANEFFTNYIQVELDKLDLQINLPQEEPQGTTGEGSETGETSESDTGSATP